MGVKGRKGDTHGHWTTKKAKKIPLSKKTLKKLILIAGKCHIDNIASSFTVAHV